MLIKRLSRFLWTCSALFLLCDFQMLRNNSQESEKSTSKQLHKYTRLCVCLGLWLFQSDKLCVIHGHFSSVGAELNSFKLFSHLLYSLGSCRWIVCLYVRVCVCVCMCVRLMLPPVRHSLIQRFGEYTSFPRLRSAHGKNNGYLVRTSFRIICSSVFCSSSREVVSPRVSREPLFSPWERSLSPAFYFLFCWNWI